ncbi:MAG: CDP-glycerol glycerophosphotransferase family protein [Campylobacterales bacterium]|nr:CDP-glycerol glycerophosphotransferase family protein [Campylobacterales bacterium]
MSFEALLSGKRYYIAPHTPKTTMLQKELQKYGEFLGFIDSNKKADDIFSPSQIKESYDFILIYSPNHDRAIYENLKQVVARKKLRIIKEDGAEYKILDKPPSQFADNFIFTCKEFFLSICVKYHDIFTKRKKILFISKSFIGSNNYALFAYMYKQGLSVVLATDNKNQTQVLATHNLPTVELDSWKFYEILGKSAWIIQDQGNWNGPFRRLSPHQKTVQLWHGIPLKRLNVLGTTVYDFHISPSNYVNETALSKVIQAKEHLNLGYPRNDMLFKEHDVLDLALCDKKLYALAKEKFENEKKVMVYMPTHRESLEDNLPPLDFRVLDEALGKIDAVMILKFHAFALAKLDTSQTYQNLHFHNAAGDIYPILKYTHVLVTDYSSVYFDFLLLNRPIIFYAYDFETYHTNMGGFVYDYETYAPGLHVKSQEGLHKAFSVEKDAFCLKRKTLCEKLFDHGDAKSSLKIYHFKQAITG